VFHWRKAIITPLKFGNCSVLLECASLLGLNGGGYEICCTQHTNVFGGSTNLTAMHETRVEIEGPRTRHAMRSNAPGTCMRALQSAQRRSIWKPTAAWKARLGSCSTAIACMPPQWIIMRAGLLAVQNQHIVKSVARVFSEYAKLLLVFCGVLYRSIWLKWRTGWISLSSSPASFSCTPEATKQSSSRHRSFSLSIPACLSIACNVRHSIAPFTNTSS